jgi:hypothetical protein
MTSRIMLALLPRHSAVTPVILCHGSGANFELKFAKA